MSGLLDTHGEWLEARKIDVETAARFSVHSRGPALAIPYYVQGKLLYAKTRDPQDKSRTRCVPSGIDQIHFWNEDCLLDEPKPKEALIITEGEFDAMVLHQAGYQFVVSMPSGTSDNEAGALSKALRVLTRQSSDGRDAVLRPEVQKFTRVVILADGDAAGLNLRKAIIGIVGEEYCWVPTYPEGTKDANDVLLTYGIEAVRDLVEKATPVKDDGFIDFITAEATISPLRPLNCGLPFLDPHFKPVRPSLIVIGGQAGHGKSTITQALLMNLLWVNSDLRASVFHAEGDKTIPIQRSKKFWKGRSSAVHITDAVKAERNRWISERLAFIKPPQDELPTFEWLMWAMEQQALYRRRNVFSIDPWNQVIHDSKRMNGNKTDYIGECIYRMKRLSDRFGLIVFVAHHTTKAIDPKTPPDRYSLADSAHWVNAADHLLLGWKPVEDQNLTRLEVAKSKDHDKMGIPGSVWVGVSGETFAMTAKLPPQRFATENINPEAAQPPVSQPVGSSAFDTIAEQL